jgi:tRNA A-37 threonylcarbamoyl transferase component Bud32
MGGTVHQERMPHGYTNFTHRSQGVVLKRYAGPDADIRQHAEVTALRYVADALPVPALVHEESGLIGTEYVAGVPGQELLEEVPDAVLRSVGRAAARLHDLDVSGLSTFGAAPAGAVLVHGDFGPQNMLFDEVTVEATAIVDWELAHLGDGVDDLAWAEWIVRTHHPHLVGSLPALFEGYGQQPPWDRRHASMIAKCEWALEFVQRWDPGNGPARAQWHDRLEATRQYRA